MDRSHLVKIRRLCAHQRQGATLTGGQPDDLPETIRNGWKDVQGRKSWENRGKSMKTPGEHGENGGFT